MKFNKGDKLIYLELDYFNNQFHFKNCIKQFTVKSCNDEYFSPFYDVEQYYAGCNSGGVKY